MNCPCCNQPLPETDVQWNAQTRTVLRGGKAVSLAPVQARFFDVLWRARPERVPREAIVQRVYADDINGGPESPNQVSVLAWLLRKKLAPIGVTIAHGRGRDGMKVEIH